MYNQRQQQLISMLTEAESFRVQSLAEILDVTGATIRNDLRLLESDGVVERIHGGVNIHPKYLTKKKYAVISDITQPIHQVMAEWALSRIHDDEAIFLDECGTTSYMVPLLEQRKKLKVFTNGIHIASALAHNEQHEVYLVGGRVSSDGRRIQGNIGCDILNTMHLQTAFISPDGYTLQSGMTQDDIGSAKSKATYLSHASEVIAIIENERFGREYIAQISPNSVIHSLITDADPDAKTIIELQNNGINVIVCGENEIKTYQGLKKTTGWKIGFANLDDHLPFCNQVRLSLEEAVSQENAGLVIHDNQLDEQKALAIVDEFIREDVDLVIEYQIYEHLGGAIMSKLRSANIPVIAVDIPIVGATYFGGDNYQAGLLAGKALGNWINETWQGNVDFVLMLQDERTGDVVASRLYGQLEGMKRYILLDDSQVIPMDCSNRPDVAGENVKQWFLDHPECHHIAIISHNDDASYGAIQAIRSLDREKDVAIVGQGCDRNIRQEIRHPDSRIIGSTAWWPEKYGPGLYHLAEKILKGEPVPPAIHLTHVFIDRENIDQHYPFDADDETEVQFLN